jgi:hypothetical protein
MQNRKRILKITLKHTMDDSPDTSMLGEYSNNPKSEFAIDRAHSEDCASQRGDIQPVKETLEHVQQTIADLHNAVLAQYNGTLANGRLDTEREALDDAYNEVGELIDKIDDCDCSGGDMGRNERRYFNGCVENYKGETPEDIRKYIRQDYERLSGLYKGDWAYVGIRAEAEIVAYNCVTQRITSGGLWGIESDSDRAHIEETEQEEFADLKTQLLVLGFSKRAISQAFKNRLLRIYSHC